ncbi:MAG: protein-L-isoaspartate(D-aspartate) O-methyltransferase [Acidobacteria bacterium]|nr:protein-L-isoaspartate(D-aspartate) O-methyltransferase [Acidobacteriota bacterium]MCA1608243.1 protein-L-isoaspartate(D-aspartate) O-methyltransferase [Acidobacteriota bacterium]
MSPTASPTYVTDGFEIPRARMVEHLRGHYRITDARVLDAMNRVPRHFFVPEALRSQAYKDNALPVASGQTISQPYIVARMTELLDLRGPERVLEVGAGTGYQTAVLSLLARRVYAVERIASLAAGAREKLLGLNLRNISFRVDDGTKGWPVYAPFDAILVAAGGPEVPQPLLDQLEMGGGLVIPIGEDLKSQNLVRIVRTSNGFASEDFGPCAFVPLIGQHGWS